MIRAILVTATGDPTDAATFATALAVARPFGAHLDVLHVRADAVRAGVAMATGGGTGALTAGLIEQLEADALQREARARSSFERFCAESGVTVSGTPTGEPNSEANPKANTVSAAFHVEIGREADWVTVYGRTCDLVVASRSDDGALMRSTLEAALLDTGRPLLIPGPSAAPIPEPIARIAIAWKPVEQAARAVALAMPLLSRATEIIIATVEENADEHDEIDRLSRYLGWHGLNPTIARMRLGPDGAAATLLSGIEGHVDLLVMGGYGHSRLRQWVFGGFTQHILAGAPLPVMLTH
jgi:nucleotide-binding universal stress UspA family protein